MTLQTHRPAIMVTEKRPRTVCIALLCASFSVVSGTALGQELLCDNDHQLILRPTTASWGTGFVNEGQQTWGRCGFVNGHEIALTAINLYPNRGEMASKDVRIYHGIGDHCSQGQLLIFNDQTQRVMILNVFDYSFEQYACLPGKP